MKHVLHCESEASQGPLSSPPYNAIGVGDERPYLLSFPQDYVHRIVGGGRHVRSRSAGRASYNATSLFTNPIRREKDGRDPNALVGMCERRNTSEMLLFILAGGERALMNLTYPPSRYAVLEF